MAPEAQGTPENLNEEPTAAEVADACRDVLGSEICDEIAAQENVDDAIQLAFTALSDVVEDPGEFLSSKGILEPVDTTLPS